MATEARLTADFWVRAYLRRLELANIPAYITRKGDVTAGAVLVKLATLDGKARLFQRSFDPDVWVIEIESRDGRTLLEEKGLSS